MEQIHYLSSTLSVITTLAKSFMRDSVKLLLYKHFHMHGESVQQIFVQWRKISVWDYTSLNQTVQNNSLIFIMMEDRQDGRIPIGSQVPECINED